jgi:hypothetical protein
LKNQNDVFIHCIIMQQPQRKPIPSGDDSEGEFLRQMLTSGGEIATFTSFARDDTGLSLRGPAGAEAISP